MTILFIAVVIAGFAAFTVALAWNQWHPRKTDSALDASAPLS